MRLMLWIFLLSFFISLIQKAFCFHLHIESLSETSFCFVFVLLNKCFGLKGIFDSQNKLSLIGVRQGEVTEGGGEGEGKAKKGL